MIKKDVGYYKPLGERTRNIYNHLKEMSVLPQSVFYKSIDINDFLYFVEREIFHQILNKVGLYGYPVIEGKRQIYEKTKTLCTKFENTTDIKLLGNSHTFSPSQLMMDESIYLSKIPNNYQFRELHSQFLKQITRCDRLMYKSPLHVTYLKKGKLIIGGNGKRAAK